MKNEREERTTEKERENKRKRGEEKGVRDIGGGGRKGRGKEVPKESRKEGGGERTTNTRVSTVV